MSGSSLAFSLKNTHMSTKSICLSLVTAFAGPFFSIFCHCHTLIHVTLWRGRARPPALPHQHRHSSPGAPGHAGLGGRGLRGAAGPPSHRHPLLRRAGKPSLQELTTHGTAPSGEPSVGLLLRVSTNWGFYLPCVHAYFSSSHLRGRRWLFKGERNAKPSPREARAPGRGTCWGRRCPWPRGFCCSRGDATLVTLPDAAAPAGARAQCRCWASVHGHVLTLQPARVCLAF